MSVSGTQNGQALSGSGTLSVDGSTGTKSGTITYSSPSPTPAGTAGPDSITIQTGKCFVGARHVGREEFVGPLELLGRAFVSLRMTHLGRYGTVSVSERARRVGDVLYSDLTAVAEFRIPRRRSLGPLREVITITGPDSMVGRGRYSYRAPGRRPIPVRYTHFYHSLTPHRLFGRLKGRSFVLRAVITTSVRGRKLKYHSRSTITRLKSR